VWLEAKRIVTTHERQISERHREREDLQFQIAQLKGRLGTVNAESDIDMSRLRDQTTQLDAELRGLADDLVKDAEPIANHLHSFPFIRERMARK
jgi:uncharacterized protein involved in exopolysaccharide biosynthesis